MEERTTMNIPVIALRGLTVFPDLTLSFDVEREISIYALDSAMDTDERLVFLVTQRDIATLAPTEDDLYTVGTICRILQILKTSETSVRVIVEGQQRARIHRLWPPCLPAPPVADQALPAGQRGAAGGGLPRPHDAPHGGDDPPDLCAL